MVSDTSDIIMLQVLKTNFSLEVRWNGESTVDVLVDESFKNRTCGLCGNFNDNSADDFKTPDGTLVSIMYGTYIISNLQRRLLK